MNSETKTAYLLSGSVTNVIPTQSSLYFLKSKGMFDNCFENSEEEDDSQSGYPAKRDKMSTVSALSRLSIDSCLYLEILNKRQGHVPFSADCLGSEWFYQNELGEEHGPFTDMLMDSMFQNGKLWNGCLFKMKHENRWISFGQLIKNYYLKLHPTKLKFKSPIVDSEADSNYPTNQSFRKEINPDVNDTSTRNVNRLVRFHSEPVKQSFAHFPLSCPSFDDSDSESDDEQIETRTRSFTMC